MDIKKTILTFMLMTLLPMRLALAGDTTITGTASCVMPDLFEFKTQPATITPNAETQPDPTPVPAGASGKYEVQKEEKLIQTEETTTVAQTDTGTEKQVSVYTICAK